MSLEVQGQPSPGPQSGKPPGDRDTASLAGPITPGRCFATWLLVRRVV